MADLERISPEDRLFDLLDLAPSPQSRTLKSLLDLWRRERAREELPKRRDFDCGLNRGMASHLFEFSREEVEGDFILVSIGQRANSLLDGVEPGTRLQEIRERRVAVYLRRLLELAIERQEAIGAWFTVKNPQGSKIHIEALVLPTRTELGEWRVLGGLIPAAGEAEMQSVTDWS